MAEKYFVNELYPYKRRIDWVGVKHLGEDRPILRVHVDLQKCHAQVWYRWDVIAERKFNTPEETLQFYEKAESFFKDLEGFTDWLMKEAREGE